MINSQFGISCKIINEYKNIMASLDYYKKYIFVFKETEIAEKIIYKLRKNTLIDMEVYKEVVDFS